MISQVTFWVEHGETTDPLETLINHVKRTPELFDDLSMIDIVETDFIVDVPSPKVKSDVDAIIALLDEKPTWDMKCGHFDAMNDPNHDCSTWDTERVTCEGCGESHDHCICDPLGNEADALRDEWRGEPGSPFDRGEPVYNREGYFR